MKNSKSNPARVWKQLDDFVVPNLALNVFDRAVYSFLLRHTRLEGKRRLLFSMAWLARGVRISVGAARPAVRRLLDRGVLRLIQRNKAGHLIEVLLPEEIRLALPQRSDHAQLSRSSNIDDLDFFRTPALRRAIHARDRGFCFYCLRRLNSTVQCLDHVVPQVELGKNSYRNLVSCCIECNSHKSQTPAADFLRWLYRQRRLTSLELAARLRALDALASGKLRPTVAAPANPIARRGRPPLASLHQRKTIPGR
jgi:HNH endonuclease